jgi:DNA invertase Pin-like site-specific DNA recombinase
VISTPFLDCPQSTFTYLISQVNEEKEQLKKIRAVWKFDQLVNHIRETIEILECFRNKFAQIKTLKGEIPISISNEEIEPMRAKIAASEKERAAKKERAANNKAAEALIKFRSGENLNNFEKDALSSTGLSFLRLKNSETVETSKGIHIELSLFMCYFWDYMNNVMKTGNMLMGRYSVSSIETEKISIGCHTFERSEILQFVESLEPANV